jgi:hypothetical protein
MGNKQWAMGTLETAMGKSENGKAGNEGLNKFIGYVIFFQ